MIQWLSTHPEFIIPAIAAALAVLFTGYFVIERLWLAVRDRKESDSLPVYLYDNE